MPILKLSSSSRRLPDAGFAFEDFSHLAVTVSSRLTRMQIRDLAQVVADALRQIAESTRIDDCHFLEFDAGGSVTLVHTWTWVPHAPDGDPQTASPEAWIVERLSRGKQVAISPDGLPPKRSRRGSGRASRASAPSWACRRCSVDMWHARSRSRAPVGAPLVAAYDRWFAAPDRDPRRRRAALPSRKRAAVERR